MIKMRTLKLSPDKQITSIVPGLRWTDVYERIGQYGRVVVGGRYATMGESRVICSAAVSALLRERHGWAENNVENYEIVIADSQILNVNASSHPDLFWASKGRSSKFSVITF